MLTFIDFFAGVGGFRRGMELAGHKCIGFCEFDKYAIASYTSMHLLTEEQRMILEEMDLKKRQKEILKEVYRNGEWFADDVRTVRAEEIPRADCWCFGFPCQDISVAGKQLGFAGHRSSLFFAVTKLVRDLEEEDRPTYLFIENVKNLLSVNGGFDFAKLLVEMDEIGYDAEWAVLNSKDFGVPQNRERVFIIGHLRGRRGGEIFPVQGTDGEDCVPVCLNSKGGRNGIPGLQPSIKDRVYDPNGIMSTVATSDFFNPNIAVPMFCDMNYGTGVVLTENARCLQARYNKGVANRSGEVSGVAVPVITPTRDTKQNGRQFKENGEPMFTLTGAARHGIAVSIDDTYGFDGVRTYEDSFPCLRSGRQGQKVGIDVERIAIKIKEATRTQYTMCIGGGTTA